MLCVSSIAKSVVFIKLHLLLHRRSDCRFDCAAKPIPITLSLFRLRSDSKRSPPHVEAVFAMLVFDWDGDGSPVIKSGFKYYWAVTAPFIIFVLVAWMLAILLPWKRWVVLGNGGSGEKAREERPIVGGTLKRGA
jgi:hypothetical protein